MSESRRFTRLRSENPSHDPGVFTLPADGLCLNVFVIIHPPASPDTVLLGRLNPAADWDHLGALGPERLARIGERWVLPSSQLLFFESPSEGANRIVLEQLEARPIPLRGPDVFSEAYARSPGERAADPHWDIHFVFRGEWTGRGALHSSAFRELTFVKPRNLAAKEFGRAHDDVLALEGLRSSN